MILIGTVSSAQAVRREEIPKPDMDVSQLGGVVLKLVAKEGVDRKEHPLPDRLVTFSGGPAQILETAADGSAWDLTNLAATDFGYEVAP